jgi:hypothetical protein
MEAILGFHPSGCCAIEIVPDDFVEHGADAVTVK